LPGQQPPDQQRLQVLQGPAQVRVKEQWWWPKLVVER
jgi:hypothetical protein